MSAADVLSGAARWCVLEGEALAVLRDLPDASVDALVTDPPYSSGGAFRGDRAADPKAKYEQSGVTVDRPTFSGDNRDARSFIFWCSLWLAECQRVTKPGAPCVVFTDWRQLPTITDLIQAHGWVWRGVLPWDKGEGTRPQPGRFRAQAEFVVWGSNGPMPLERDAPVLPGAYRVPVRQDDKHHLTGKPTELMRELVKITERGGVVLDPFAGSGTTGVAALLEGYRFIGVERVAEYVRVARERCAGAAGEWTAATGAQGSLFAAEGGR